MSSRCRQCDCEVNVTFAERKSKHGPTDRSSERLFWCGNVSTTNWIEFPHISVVSFNRTCIYSIFKWIANWIVCYLVFKMSTRFASLRFKWWITFAQAMEEKILMPSMKEIRKKKEKNMQVDWLRRPLERSALKCIHCILTGLACTVSTQYTQWHIKNRSMQMYIKNMKSKTISLEVVFLLNTINAAWKLRSVVFKRTVLNPIQTKSIWSFHFVMNGLQWI